MTMVIKNSPIIQELALQEMKTIQAGKFKAHCLALLDEVAQTNEVLVITKHGRPVAKVLPFDSKKDDTDLSMRGLATYVGDLISPVEDEWEAVEL
jgi:prevent-host-death family protein